ncbi:diguanylate cyclase domain-containing protein [Aquabacterium sp.]|uniref:diguanylate cyclase domain-containing protein n=1 Tax=Aquabacterium sp. TaxID=1872578 RepID=UPI003784B31E
MAHRPHTLLLCLGLAATWAPPALAADVSVRTLLDQSRAAVRNDPERSRQLAQQALAELARQPDADLEVLAHVQLCDYFSERDRPQAEQHLQAGQALLPRSTRPALAAQLLGCEGELRELAGDSARALQLYERAVANAEQSHDSEVLANALYQRGYLRGVRGELASGLADLKRASDLFDRLQKTEEGLNTLLAAALLYDRMGDPAQARRHFEQALAAQRRAGLQREQAVTLHNLGRALENLGDHAAARESFNASLALSEKLGYPRGRAYALRGLASVANREGDGATALRQAQAAAALLGQAPDQRLQAQIALQQGIALRLLQRPAESLQVLGQALGMFEKADSPAEATATRGELATTQAALGDYKAAFEQAQAFKAASDRLLKRQIDERFASLRNETEATAAQRENAATQRALAEEQRANRLRTVSLLLASLLVAVLSVLLLRHRRAGRRMHALAMTDELTQLRNRRAVLDTLQQQLARGERGALLIADLDLFKPINDQHGHLVGDAILRAVAEVLRNVMPREAELGRLGGEEFVAVLPGAEREAALGVAEAARAAVAALDASRWLPDRGVSISIGVTGFAHGDTLTDILRRADEALYEAKHAGRNRVRWMARAPAAEDYAPSPAAPARPTEGAAPGGAPV